MSGAVSCPIIGLRELSKSDKFTAAFPDDAQGQADQEQDPQKFAKLELERIKGKTKT